MNRARDEQSTTTLKVGGLSAYFEEHNHTLTSSAAAAAERLTSRGTHFQLIAVKLDLS